MRRIVVGIDGSPASRLATRFALESASRRPAVVEAVIAYHRAPHLDAPMPGAPLFVAGTSAPVVQEARKALDDVVDGEHARMRPTDVRIERIVVEGAAGPTLVDVAQGADLLVTGSRGLGAIEQLLLGSVSRHCVTHAPCPVAVVPWPADDDAPARTGAIGRIVVGVDGSDSSRNAVLWALDEATRRGATLDVVHAFPYVDGGSRYAAFAPTRTFPEAQRAAAAHLDAVLDDLVTETTTVPIERHTVEGAAAEQLLVRAADADLLVVGSRGLGTARGLLLGSVSQQCLNLARCPVVVVPPPERWTGPTRAYRQEVVR